ncbi:FAD-dependent oxidoreductase [Streptomyces sp. URMC 127]
MCMTAVPETNLLIVGAGPAGVAAAVMAGSLGMRSTLIEAGQVGGKLHHIGALENMPGNWQTGPALADALAADIARITQSARCRLLRGRAVRVDGHDHHVEVVLDDGQVLTAAAAVVATGVTTLAPQHTDWVTVPEGLWAPPLWRACPEDLHGVTYVIGADRPLGTWLRAHPHVQCTLNVLCPPEDDYKAAEVATDARVRLLPISRVVITEARHSQGSWEICAESRSGEQTGYVASTVLNNLGNRPSALEGLMQGSDGYCPPDQQHPRVLIAGDLRSARFQRIITAQGSGAQAALTRYYGTALVTA